MVMFGSNYDLSTCKFILTTQSMGQMNWLTDSKCAWVTYICFNNQIGALNLTRKSEFYFGVYFFLLVLA